MPSQVAVARFERIARRLRREEDGQDLLEYALLCSLIAIVAFGAVSTVGNTIHTVFWQVIANTY